MDLQDSLTKLNSIYTAVVNNTENEFDIDSFEFASAWEGSRLFRDHSLLNFAKYAFTKISNNKEMAGRAGSTVIDDKKIYYQVSRNLVQFTFRFFSAKQIALTFDLAASLIDSPTFESISIEIALSSDLYSERSFDALKLGISGLSLFNVEKLSLPKAGTILQNPIFPAAQSSLNDATQTISSTSNVAHIKNNDHGIESKSGAPLVKMDPARFKSTNSLGASFLFDSISKGTLEDDPMTIYAALQNQASPHLNLLLDVNESSDDNIETSENSDAVELQNAVREEGDNNIQIPNSDLDDELNNLNIFLQNDNIDGEEKNDTTDR